MLLEFMPSRAVFSEGVIALVGFEERVQFDGDGGAQSGGAPVSFHALGRSTCATPGAPGHDHSSALRAPPFDGAPDGVSEAVS